MSVDLLSASDEASGCFKGKKKYKHTHSSVHRSAPLFQTVQIVRIAYFPLHLSDFKILPPPYPIREFGLKCIVMRTRNAITKFFKPLFH